MSITRKIVWIGIAQLTLLGAVLVGAYYVEARNTVVQQYVEKSRVIAMTAESTREEMGRKWAQGIFTTELLSEWGKRGEIDKVLSAVPVVTAWRAAMDKSREGGYTFRVPKFQPRNRENEPDPIEARALRMFEKDGVGEHYEIDPARNAIRYFRPIRLTAECLNCHGDPANSVRLWGNANGQDPTGGPMENWKVGEVHGAFEVVQSLDKADAQIRASMRNGLLVMAALVALSAMAFAFLMMRQVVRPFNHVVSGLASGAAEVAAVADQVSQASQTLAHGASEQAASLEQTSASMEQMAATTRQNAEHTSRAAGLMATVDQRVSASTRELESMVATMNAIKHSSGRVAQIIKTIDEIAFQTNILALNAAVEAARAGDAGSGFAVVADEVRTLAQRSAQAARDTADLIAEALDNATKGSARVRDLEASVRGITESVADVKQLVDNVSVASQEQAKGAAQVGQALHQMERVTQSNAAASEEGAASSEELSAQAEVARGLVEELRALMSGAQVGQSGDMERPGRSKRAA